MRINYDTQGAECNEEFLFCLKNGLSNLDAFRDIRYVENGGEL